MINNIPDWLEDESILIVPEEFEADGGDDISALSKEYEEQLLIQDIVFCLVGATGVYFKTNKSGKFQLSGKLRNKSNSKFIEMILSLCDNVAFIKKYADCHFNFECGRILHAMCASLKLFLSDFTQFVAKIESYQQLSFPVLLSKINPHFEAMHSVAELIRQIGAKRGCKALSIIYTYLTECRDEKIRRIIFFIFQSSSEPLVHFIEKWIYNGLIDDPFEEFFIKVNEAIINEEFDEEYEGRFWQLRFLIVEKQIPAFLPPSSVLKILLSGKSKAVLSICGEKLEKTAGLSIQSLQRGVVLDSALFSASLQLMNALRNKFNLVHYFDMLHSVFLGGRGSWLSVLFRSANKILKKERQLIHLPSFDATLSMTLPESMKSNFYTEIEDELFSEQIEDTFATGHAKKENERIAYTASSTNWDYVCVKMKVEWPLIILFPKTVQQKYQMLFRNILSWRYLEHKLSKLWHSSNGIRAIDNTRHTILLFVRGYLDFISLYIICPKWTELLNQSQKTRNIEELFQIHDASINDAFKGLLLTEPKIFHIMSCILFYGFQYAKEIKKWSNSISNCVTTKESKNQLARPIYKIFDAFKRKVQSLIVRMNEMGKKDETFSNFIIWVDINGTYQIKTAKNQ